MILVTGGAGYIGTHTVVELINDGKDVVILDNFCNSNIESVKRVEKITGKRVSLFEGDIRDTSALEQVFARYDIKSVIHFAGLKAVGESVSYPMRYYENNVVGTLNLCQVMSEHNVKKLVFSSSATVYGDPKHLPINESAPSGQTTNPYGTSKYMVERLLSDIANSDPDWQIIALRYFNPVGAHSSGLIGEDPNGIPNNLLPYISKVAIGALEQLSIYGNDYDTEDGTGVRDYIHVVDLAQGHLSALGALSSGFNAINLGTGNGYSVLQMVKAFEKASGRKVPYRITERRPGDIAACYADVSFAKQMMNWEAKLDLDDIMRDTWRWQSMNPNGYSTTQKVIGREGK